MWKFSRLFALITVLLCLPVHCSGISLYALFNMRGIEGTINFIQDTEKSNVTIVVQFNRFSSAANYSWYITQNLMSYFENDRCNKRTLGNRLHDLNERHGPLHITSDAELHLHDSQLTLFGAATIWEKSIVLEGSETVCANILSLEPVRVAQAVFTTTVAGSVTFRQMSTNRTISTLITTDLFHVSSDAPSASTHNWKILVTDVLDSRPLNRRFGTCDHLTILYDPDNVDSSECSSDKQSHCKKGDLTGKHGQVPIGAKRSRYSRLVVFDANLPFPDLEGSRYLYVAIYDSHDSNEVLACAKIREVGGKESQARFLARGVRGMISFRQQSALDPTHVTINMTGLNNQAVFYHVHLYPVPPPILPQDADRVCSVAGDHFNPLGIDRKLGPAPGNATYERYEVGDLSGKYGLLQGDHFYGEFLDPYLTLYGPHSIVGRSIVVHREDSSRWLCANLEYPTDVVTAVAQFVYPVVGRVIFRQEAGNPLGDTTVYLESLVFDDGTKNFSSDHQWSIHAHSISNDSLDWKQRCVSAGPGFNPYGVNVGANGYRDCRGDTPQRCIVGDLTKKVGRASVASTSTDANRTQLFYTDTSLPLTGVNGIIGRSLVLQDDRAPDFRGNRMACAGIFRQHPAKARVSEWHTSGSPSEVMGRITMEQPTEFDITTTSVELRGLDAIASGFHVHEVSVPLELVFPCTNDAVYGHFNPFAVNNKLSPPPGMGSSDQYELGDLSGKYGTLEEERSVYFEAPDSNLPLRGMNSILGRSVVIHKQEKGERWVCGNVEFVKDNARQIQAIASFHHPKGFAYGYVRLNQLEYEDGSLSDTTIEINLHYPGVNNRNVTSGHHWAVHVNQVGEDMAVKEYIARCIAAGYRWNPFRVKSDREDYAVECNAHNHFACEMGDISGRQGPIDVGGPRKLFTDSNLPLTGNYTVMKKSILIFEKNGDGNRFACANIEPDNDIVQKVQIKKDNHVSSQFFINKVREVMAVPEWMMYLVTGETRDVGYCIHYTIYFRGPDANRIQLDFDKLLNTGSIDRPYASAPGELPKKKPSFPFRTCSTAMDSITDGSSSIIAVPSVTAVCLLLSVAISQLLK